ncbi:MAG: hypothetical protein WAJ91_16075, partial [Rhodoplanes sp.]
KGTTHSSSPLLSSYDHAHRGRASPRRGLDHRFGKISRLQSIERVIVSCLKTALVYRRDASHHRRAK